MKLYFVCLVFIGLLTLAIAGCMHPIKKIEKECMVGRYSEQRCMCRDAETGHFTTCR